MEWCTKLLWLLLLLGVAAGSGSAAAAADVDVATAARTASAPGMCLIGLVFDGSPDGGRVHPQSFSPSLVRSASSGFLGKLRAVCVVCSLEWLSTAVAIRGKVEAHGNRKIAFFPA